MPSSSRKEATVQVGGGGNPYPVKRERRLSFSGVFQKRVRRSLSHVSVPRPSYLQTLTFVNMGCRTPTRGGNIMCATLIHKYLIGHSYAPLQEHHMGTQLRSWHVRIHAAQTTAAHNGHTVKAMTCSRTRYLGHQYL
ncbi:hypothetical protein ACJW30_09G071200 [Castanea mollissima]